MIYIETINARALCVFDLDDSNPTFLHNKPATDDTLVRKIWQQKVRGSEDTWWKKAEDANHQCNLDSEDGIPNCVAKCLGCKVRLQKDDQFWKYRWNYHFCEDLNPNPSCDLKRQ